MRVLIDAQLPPGLCAWFRDHGVEAEHVRDRLGGQASDAEIARYATEQRFVLLTKDDDFRLRHPPGDYRLVWIRCGNLTNCKLRVWLEQRWPETRRRLDEGDIFLEVW